MKILFNNGDEKITADYTTQNAGTVLKVTMKFNQKLLHTKEKTFRKLLENVDNFCIEKTLLKLPQSQGEYNNTFQFNIPIRAKSNSQVQCVLLHNILNEKINDENVIDYMSFLSKNFLSGSLKILLRCYRKELPNFSIDPKRVLLIKHNDEINIVLLGIGESNNKESLENMKKLLNLNDRKEFTRKLIKLGLFKGNKNDDIYSNMNKYLKHVLMSDAFFEYKYTNKPNKSYNWNEAKLISDKVNFNGMELKKVFDLISNKDKDQYKPVTWNLIKRYYKNITRIMKNNISSVPKINVKKVETIVVEENKRQNHNNIIKKLKQGGSPMTAILK